MLKCILLLLSEYYYEIAESRLGEICDKVNEHQVHVTLKRTDQHKRQETLVITDEPETAECLLKDGWYVVILYHEKNRDKTFPQVRYAVEDLFLLEYRSYEEVFKRLAGLPWDILETDRLKVRESTLEDVDAFYRIYSEPSITYYMEDLYQKREEEEAYMQAYIDQVYGFYGYGLWTILLKETGEVIGLAGLSFSEGYELPELGFVIDSAHQNKGYAFEVCTAILIYAKEELAFDQVQALVNERNKASLRLLGRLGFEFQSNVVVSDCDYKFFVKKC